MIKIKEKELKNICDNLVSYWNSLKGGTFVDGLLDAMQSLSHYSEHPHLETALMRHEYLSKRSLEDKEQDVSDWESYLKSPCKVLWVDDGGFPMCKYHNLLKAPGALMEENISKGSVSCFLVDILFHGRPDESKCPDGRKLK